MRRLEISLSLAQAGSRPRWGEQRWTPREMITSVPLLATTRMRVDEYRAGELRWADRFFSPSCVLFRAGLKPSYLLALFLSPWAFSVVYVLSWKLVSNVRGCDKGEHRLFIIINHWSVCFWPVVSFAQGLYRISSLNSYRLPPPKATRCAVAVPTYLPFFMSLVSQRHDRLFPFLRNCKSR